jgi:hypothetical protein
MLERIRRKESGEQPCGLKEMENKLNKLKELENDVIRKISKLKAEKKKKERKNKTIQKFEMDFTEKKFNKKNENFLINYIINRTNDHDEDTLSCFERSDLIAIIHGLGQKKVEEQKKTIKDISVDEIKDQNKKNVFMLSRYMNCND